MSMHDCKTTEMVPNTEPSLVSKAVPSRDSEVAAAALATMTVCAALFSVCSWGMILAPQAREEFKLFALVIVALLPVYIVMLVIWAVVEVSRWRAALRRRVAAWVSQRRCVSRCRREARLKQLLDELPVIEKDGELFKVMPLEVYACYAGCVQSVNDDARSS